MWTDLQELIKGKDSFNKGAIGVFSFPPWQHITIYIFGPVNECMCEYRIDYIMVFKLEKAHRASHVVLKLWGSTSVAAISHLPGSEDIK